MRTSVRIEGASVTDRSVPVLVVGGSLVGLSTSLLLASSGVPHLLVERHRGTAVHPRAASFHQRTMEIFRSVGLQSAVEAAAEKEFEETGVTSTIRTREGAEQETVRSDYLVAADGAHSRVRELARIGSAGRGSFAECVTIY